MAKNWLEVGCAINLFQGTGSRRAFFLCQEQDLLERAGFLCQEQDLLGKIRISLPRARSPWQDQGFFAKRKISLARSGFLCQEKDLPAKRNQEIAPCERRLGQEQCFFGKVKVSLARAKFLWQEQSFFGKSRVSLARARSRWHLPVQDIPAILRLTYNNVQLTITSISPDTLIGKRTIRLTYFFYEDTTVIVLWKCW